MVQTVNNVNREESPLFQVGDVVFYTAEELGRFYLVPWFLSASESHLYNDTVDAKDYTFRAFRQLVRNIHQDWFENYEKLKPLKNKNFRIFLHNSADYDTLMKYFKDWEDDALIFSRVKVERFTDPTKADYSKNEADDINVFIFDKDDNKDIVPESFVTGMKNIYSFCYQKA